MFDYSKIKLFDKSGNQLVTDIKKSDFFYIKSDLPEGHDALLYPLTDASGNIVKLVIEDSGMLYDTNVNRSVTLYDMSNTAVATIDLVEDNYAEFNTSDGILYGIDNLSTPKISYSAVFPSINISSHIDFERVSTELFETECIYLLKETIEDNVLTYSKLSDSDFESGRYDLLFLIDSSTQNEFKMFDVDYITDDITYTTAKRIHFTGDDETPCRLNLSFSAKEEGVYEETLYMCILDNENDDEPYLLGKILLHGESIGEDERYRTLFTNFGVPDPKTYMDIFKESGIDEDKDDMELLNRKSKELFLSYSEIFPYIGTYKALVNAVSFLGYNDINFKEWYKESSKDLEGRNNYVTFDISYKNEYSKNRINALSIEERMSMKKLNWLSMMYKLNKVVDSEYEQALPDVVNAYDYRNDELMIKLYALKNWLEKNIIAQNCRIIEITGEGVYFESTNYLAYALHSEDYEYSAERRLTPYLKGNLEDRVLIDGSANIIVGIREIDEMLSKHDYTINDLANLNVGDYDESDFYIDVDNVCVKSVNDGYDESLAEEGKHILIRKTFLHPIDFEFITIKAETSSENHLFTAPFIKSSSNNLWIHDGEIMFEPINYYQNNTYKEAEFDILPEIYIEHAYLRDPLKVWDDMKTRIELINTVLKPSDSAYLKYTENNQFGVPVFLLKGYLEGSEKEYVLDLQDGTFTFENSIESHPEFVYLNFNYDTSTGEQTVETNFVFIQDHIGIDETIYDSNFVQRYLENPDTAFNIKDEFGINVYKTGIYNITVYGFDEYNNIFGQTIAKKPKILMSAGNIKLYAEQIQSNNNPEFYNLNVEGISTDRDYIKGHYTSNAVLKPNYLIPDFVSDNDRLIYKNISYAIDTPKENDILRLYNVSDKFIIKSGSNGNYIIERYGSIASNTFLGTLEMYNSAPFKEYCSVNCVIFDTIYDTPIVNCKGYIYADNKIIHLIIPEVPANFDELKNNNTLYVRNTAKYHITDASYSEINDETALTVNGISTVKNGILYQPGQRIKIVIRDTSIESGSYNVLGEMVYIVKNITDKNKIIIDGYYNPEYIITYPCTYVMYPSELFINYKMYCKSAIENIEGNTEVFPVENPAIDFIDNTYSLLSRDFDIAWAYNDWYEKIVPELYEYNIPITLMNNLICVGTDDENKHFWRIYKHSDGYETELCYELYNPWLFLELSEHGIYDIEMFTYDNLGNLTSKIFKGAFKF